MAEEIKTVSARVEHLLDRYWEARNNDKTLHLLYWSIYDGIDIFSMTIQDYMTKATSVETLNRARREIQSSGNLLPTDEIIIKRRRLQEVYREHYGRQ